MDYILFLLILHSLFLPTCDSYKCCVVALLRCCGRGNVRTHNLMLTPFASHRHIRPIPACGRKMSGNETIE